MQKRNLHNLIVALILLCASSICSVSCHRGSKSDSMIRIAGRHGYKETYLDLPDKQGYFLYSIGDIFIDGNDYCLSAVYARYDEENNISYITDIFTVDMSGNIRYTLEISKMQIVREIFETEYVFFAYSDNDLISIRNKEKELSELKTDLVFFDKKNGVTTRVIHPEFNADAIFNTSVGFIIVGNRNVAKYSPDGVLESTIETDFTISPRETSIFEDSGNIYMLTSNNEWISDYYKLDFELKEAEYIIGSDSLSSEAETFSGQYFFGLEGEYKVDLINMQIETMALWNEVNIRPKKMNNAKRSFVALDDTHFAQKTVYIDGTGEVGFFNYDNSINDDCVKIVVGGYGVYTDEILAWAVYNFNTQNDKYRVVLEEYSDEFSSSTPQEAQEAQLRLLKYFNDGHAPDVFYGDRFDYEYLGHSGMIMDMLPFFDNDSSLQFTDFSSSIQGVLLRDGKHCYSVFSGYYMDGYWGMKSDFPTNQISLTELQKKCQDSDKQFTATLSSPCIACESLVYSVGSLWGAYDKPKIISREQIVDFVNATIDLGIDPSITWGGVCDMQAVYDGVCYLSTAGPSDIFTLAREEKKAHDRLVYVGYPTIGGSAHLLVPSGLVGISASTRHADKCWVFVRNLLLTDMQKRVVQYGKTPIRGDVLEMMFQSALNPSEVRDEDMRRFVLGQDEVSLDVVEDFRMSVNSIDTIRTIDWGAYNIICEEVASYYTQNRSVEQIADSLDTRLSLYVQENYE